MDRKDLKIQALLERVSSLTAEYENKVADLRVDLTMVSQDRDQLQEQLNSQANSTEPTHEEVVHKITELPASDTD